MEIRSIKNFNAYDLKVLIQKMVDESRFKVEDIEFVGVGLKIHAIRLKRAKDYCGNHPAMCEIAGRSRKGVWLEGLDWVDFNDTINDLFDSLNLSATIKTSVCWIRKGTLRRVNYDYHNVNGFPNGNTWDYNGDDEDWEEWCGKIAPASTYPFGTPGLYERDVSV